MKHDPIQIFSRFVKETPEVFKIIGLRKPNKTHIKELRNGIRSLFEVMMFVIFDNYKDRSTINVYDMISIWVSYLRKQGYYERTGFGGNSDYVICRRKRT